MTIIRAIFVSGFRPSICGSDFSGVGHCALEAEARLLLMELIRSLGSYNQGRQNQAS